MITLLTFKLGPPQTNCYVLLVKNQKQCLIIDPGIPSAELIETIQNHVGISDDYSEKIIILLTHGHYDHIGAVQKLLEVFKGASAYMNVKDKSVAQGSEQQIANRPHLNVYDFSSFNADIMKPLNFLDVKDWADTALIESIISQVGNESNQIQSDIISNVIQMIQINNSNHKCYQFFGKVRMLALHTPGHTPGSSILWFPQQNWLFTGDTLFAKSVGRYDFPYASKNDLLTSLQKLKQTFSEALQKDSQIFPGHEQSIRLDIAFKNVQWFVN